MSRIRTVKPEAWIDRDLTTSDLAAHLYCIAEPGCEDTGPCKIGVATHLGKRLSSLQGGNWRPLAYAWTIRLRSRMAALAVEQHVLIMLRPNPYSNETNTFMSEWVRQSPREALSRAVAYLNSETEDQVVQS